MFSSMVLTSFPKLKFTGLFLDIFPSLNKSLWIRGIEYNNQPRLGHLPFQLRGGMWMPGEANKNKDTQLNLNLR